MISETAGVSIRLTYLRHRSSASWSCLTFNETGQRDLREQRAPAGPEELAEFETDVLAGFVLARASAGLADATIRPSAPERVLRTLDLSAGPQYDRSLELSFAHR
jgi:hypothetical protein